MANVTSDLSKLYIQNFPTVNDAIKNLINALVPGLLLEDISIIIKYIGCKQPGKHNYDEIYLYTEEMYLKNIDDESVVIRDFWSNDFRRLTTEEFTMLRSVFIINYQTGNTPSNQIKHTQNDDYDLA